VSGRARSAWLPRPYRSRLANVLLVVLGALALGTAIGLADLWPQGTEVARGKVASPLSTEAATVTAVDAEGCRSAPAAVLGQGPECRRVTARLWSGPEAGEEVAFDIGGAIEIGTGDRVRVSDSKLPADAVVGGVPADRYAFSDFERRSSLLWLTAAFAVLVIASARWQGLRALVGLAASLAVVVLFVVPAILEGTSPVAVATVGALAIMLVTIPLAHGLGPKAIAACLGTAAALAITLVLATWPSTSRTSRASRRRRRPSSAPAEPRSRSRACCSPGSSSAPSGCRTT
jgi:YibE/F-like protein